MRQLDDSASSAPLTFAIAGTILLTIIGSALFVTSGAASDPTASQSANLRVDADGLVDRFTESKGVGWDVGPDSVTDVGLRNSNGSGLDLSRISAMKGAGYDAAANDKLDYHETLSILGMDPDGAGNVHLRIAPIGLESARQGGDLGRVRTLYIADFENPDTSIDVLLNDDEAMIADARQQLEIAMTAEAALERAALEYLGLGFDNQTTLIDWDVDAVLPPLYEEPLEDVVNVTRLEGDVYPDHKQHLNDRIPGVIDEYDLVIVGANVDHSALTSNAFKQAIDDWVDAGGILIVFGSDSQSFQWLESLMGAGVETANGGAFAPDVDHPLLREPHQLAWPDYENFDQAWGGKNGKNNNFDALFQHVVGSDDGDVLAVSLDGAFGDGRVFLSTYRPADIYDDISITEASGLINNLVVYSLHNGLYLDYGPAPPQDVEVAGASRTSHVWDPDFGLVPVRVTVLTWGV